MVIIIKVNKRKVVLSLKLCIAGALFLLCNGCIQQHYSCRFILCNRSASDVTATLRGESDDCLPKVVKAGQCESLSVLRKNGEKGTIEITNSSGERQVTSVVAINGMHEEVTVDFPSSSWSKADQH